MNLISLANRVVYFPVKNAGAVERIFNHLIKTNHENLILPYIDHPGPLTNVILSKQFDSLTVCERDPDKRREFQTLVQDEHMEKKIHIHPDDLFDLSYRTYNDVAQKRCAELVRENLNLANGGINVTDYCDRHVKFLVPLLRSKNEVGFLKNLYYQMSLKIGMCTDSLVHYYFLMSDRQHNYLIAKPRANMMLYRSSTILYNTIFNIKTLESFDLEDCFGISIKRIQSTAAARNDSYRQVHLVWLEPRCEVVNFLDSKSLLEYRFLVTQMMHKRKELVVKFLEKFFFNLQADLAQYNIDETTRSGDLSRDQFYQLFLYLRMRPDYKHSTFLHAASNYEDSSI